MLREPVYESGELADIQEGQETRKIYVNQVGIKDILVPIIYILNGKNHNSVGTAKIAVDLQLDKRAIHMSRLVECLNEWDGVITNKSICRLLENVMKRLEAVHAYIEMEFTYFMNKIAPVSKKPGIMNYQCKIKATMKKKSGVKYKISIKVPITSVCPCSKSISKYGAHNQRGIVNVSLVTDNIEIIPDVIQRVESSSSGQLYSLLKRIDEKYVTEYAYDNAKFVEDIARDVIVKLKECKSYTDFSVHVENYESIHNHNAYAFVVSEDLRKVDI